ncbi:response regulator transcription factor [Alicyclobacillus cycloheptanicus]|uniref:DNA-binding response OmpR family regulator n=1 Tax=Alicyclobacillus cycloheptanicus TaxID=1457 RepID=A0ABT9XKR8_9BACL|nr:response regulator transcription factor [Alicyclobacillus cycloheptanicus]MDQ0190904.1 DNA-binding response OmpR family regulator [Alicyclobacillus cycloheptanicus]WDM01789.1 response regulator transcription factor [Alicyclobacillus cycloheptanicus]
MGAAQIVCVVDDDPSIVELMRDFLENDGFCVVSADNAEDALALFARVPVDCMIVDVMMPGQSGFELCKQIRAESDVPILFLSARDDDVSKIRGLGLGGDDYIVKSASPGEVVARVKAILRRTSIKQSPRQLILDFGRLVLLPSSREVMVAGQSVSLTPKEYELLSLFARHPRQVFTYDQLLDQFWEGVGDKHTIRVHIGRIREKIERDANHPEYIVNVWGIGYRFEGTPR